MEGSSVVDMMREGSGEGICAETKWLTKECRGVNSQIRTVEVKERFPRVGEGLVYNARVIVTDARGRGKKRETEVGLRESIEGR